MNTKKFTAALAVVAFICPATAYAEEGGVDVSASLTGATDYVWRGISQSNEDPAVFAAVNVSVGGFYAGAGTENVDFPGIKQEYDLWAGYSFNLGKGAKLDLGVVRYGYVNSPVDIDTAEVNVGVSVPVGKVSLATTVYHTWDYFGTGENANYIEGSASFPIAEKLTASAAFGHQQISNLPNYNNWNLGLSYQVIKGAKVDVRYHDTDTNAFGTLADSRVVGSFSVAF